MAAMFGVIVIVLLLVVIVPVGVLMSGGVLAGIIGWALRRNGEQTHEGSELIATNE